MSSSGQYPRGRRSKTTTSTKPAVVQVKLLGGKLYTVDANGNQALVGTVVQAGGAASTASTSAVSSIAYAIALGDL